MMRGAAESFRNTHFPFRAALELSDRSICAAHPLDLILEFASTNPGIFLPFCLEIFDAFVSLM